MVICEEASDGEDAERVIS